MILVMSDAPSPLRLRKKHGTGMIRRDATAADGKRLSDAQSVRNAIVAGLIAVIIFSLLWVVLTEITNQVFPWFTVVLGFMLGHSVRMAGRGTDWRFPLIAAVLAIGGALFANIVVAASVTAEEFGTSALHILQAVTSMTWAVFFDEVLTIADAFFAVIGAGLAAFYASRRLTRSEYLALRRWGEERNKAPSDRHQ